MHEQWMLRFEGDMRKEYGVCRMQESDVARAVDIWVEQYQRYCGRSQSFPCNWIEGTSEIAGFLYEKVKAGTALTVKSGNRLLGYMTYDEFPFNGEKSAFCPSIAHAAIDEHKEEVYLTLYKHVSREWIERNNFNHMWTIFYNDDELRAILFDWGFGSYLIDAFAGTDNTVVVNPAHVIRKAEPRDVATLCGLVEESRTYYASPPLFLRRDRYAEDDIVEIVKRGNVFVAWRDDDAIGFINVNVSQGDNRIDLSANKSGLIDEIGAYVKPEFRGRGVGKELLRHAFDYCRDNGIVRIHVDYETANPYANKFWRKYFDPMLLSLRRTINKNINDEHIEGNG